MSETIFIWLYVVAPAKREAFIAAYNSSGGWAEWLSHAIGFTVLDLVETIPCTFILWEAWQSEEARRGFVREYEAEYRERCLAMRSLYEREIKVQPGDLG